jgi:hypothetical protein
MSRSYKKSPYFSVCKGKNDSDKFDKQLTNRAFRSHSHIALRIGNYEALPLKLTEARDVYDFVSDGPKRYWGSVKKEWMRK